MFGAVTSAGPSTGGTGSVGVPVGSMATNVRFAGTWSVSANPPRFGVNPVATISKVTEPPGETALDPTTVLVSVLVGVGVLVGVFVGVGVLVGVFVGVGVLVGVGVGV